MASDFREYIKAWSPSWLRTGNNEKYMGALGLMLDRMAEATRLAISMRSITSPDFPSDAQGLVGQERTLPRFPLESEAAYVARLQDAWLLWHEAGTQGGIADMFARLGTAIAFKTNATWNWDTQPINWSRFWVVITTHSWTNEGTWDGAGTWDDGGTWDTTATPDEVRAVRGIVRSFKGAHEICPAICVVLDGVTWAANQPNGTWGNYANRSPSASYWDG